MKAKADRTILQKHTDIQHVEMQDASKQRGRAGPHVALINMPQLTDTVARYDSKLVIFRFTSYARLYMDLASLHFFKIL